MSLVHAFTLREFLTGKAQSPPELAKVLKACAKATSPDLAKKFVAAFKAHNFSALARATTGHIQKHAIGLKLLPDLKKPEEYTTLEKMLAKALLGPQKLVLVGKVDLSIHLKDKKLELHFTDHKGGKSVLLSIGP